MKALVINFGYEYLGVEPIEVETELPDLKENEIVPYLEDWFYDLYDRCVSEIHIDGEVIYHSWGWDFS